MKYRPNKAYFAVFLFLLASAATGQDDRAKQKAIDQMRQVAEAIKQCPEEKSSFQDECKIYYSYLGPPTNVEWDVLPSKTARSPFQGIIEFVLLSRAQDEDIDPAKQSEKVHQQCVDRKESMVRAKRELEAPILAQAMGEGPKWREGHYRYEFDVGSDAPELIKMLWVVKDKDNNTVTSATNDRSSCWGKAAREIRLAGKR